MTDAALPPPGASSRARLRDVEWWYLGYLGILLFPVVFDPTATTVDAVVVAVAVVVFLPIYVAACLGSERTAIRCAVASTALGVLVFTSNPASSVFLVYAASFVGTSSRERAIRWLFGLTGVVALLAATAAVRGLDPLYLVMGFLPGALFIWVIGLAVIGETQRARESARLRIDNARIAHLATATERERIARDLHDLLGHTLTSIVVRAQLVQRLADDDADRAGDEAAAIEAAARDALAEVRATVAGWRQVGLDEELDAARGALAAVGVELEVQRQDDLRLAPSVEAALALSLRESVTNVVRHAQARRCTVSLAREGDEVTLRVSDDGVGGGADGGGLTGMRERIAALGGHVERRSRPGTSLTVAIPSEVAG